MNRMHLAALTLALTLAGVSGPVALAQRRIEINGNNYAAIAYSPSTQSYGYCYDCGTLGYAKRQALSHCPEADARILTWVQFGWAALVVAEDGAYGYSTTWGGSAQDALVKAKRELRKHTNRPIKKTLIVCSGDVDPIEREGE